MIKFSPDVWLRVEDISVIDTQFNGTEILVTIWKGLQYRRTFSNAAASQPFVAALLDVISGEGMTVQSFNKMSFPY